MEGRKQQDEYPAMKGLLALKNKNENWAVLKEKLNRCRYLEKLPMVSEVSSINTLSVLLYSQSIATLHSRKWSKIGLQASQLPLIIQRDTKPRRQIISNYSSSLSYSLYEIKLILNLLN